MTFNNSFRVNLICDVFNTDTDEKVECKSIFLNLDIETAKKILYRYEDPAFVINGYKFLYKFDSAMNKPMLITLFKDNFMYVVTNANEFVNEVMEGFETLIILNHLVETRTFDYSAAVDLLEVKNKDTTPEVDDEGARYSAYI